ncbi:MAG TPA: M23 family metallopeptidase, partial [Flavobacterium sp.]
MKKATLLFLILINSFAIPLKAQDLIISKNNEVLTYNTTNKYISRSSEKQQTEKYKQVTYLDNLAYHTDQIALELKESDNYDFAQGIQSPFNSNLWIYLEREEIGAGYYIREYDKKLNKIRNILFNENKLRKDIAFKPIAWTNNVDELYVEGLYLNSAEEHEGIWVLNIKSRKLTKINLGFNYMSTPIVSENREKFYFLGTLDAEIDYLHGRTDIVYEFDLITNKRTIVTQSKGDSMIIHGWENQLTNTTTTPNQVRVSNLDYYLPWDFGLQYCVSRHGTPAPSGAHTHMGRCNVFAGGQHGYAGIDFDTSNSIDENVRAAANGRVTFTGISGSLTSGYGRLVIITHSDGTRTYYAHNKTILVAEGQNVTRSQIIAKEGTTGGSTGDHIHFEWRAAGGTSPTIGSFKDIGQPRQDYRYKSNNTSTPISTIPVLNTPAAGASVPSPVKLTWSTSVSGASCRIQVSKVNTGWTAADGFTTETAATENV